MLKKNVSLYINLMTRLQHDALPLAGKTYLGFLECKSPSDNSPNSDEFAFEEVILTPTVVRRNVCTYDGKHITATRRLTDGKPRLNFKNLHIDGSFNVDRFSIEVMNEIREALKGFVED
jgi:hypothetical protein